MHHALVIVLLMSKNALDWRASSSTPSLPYCKVNGCPRHTLDQPMTVNTPYNRSLTFSKVERPGQYTDISAIPSRQMTNVHSMTKPLRSVSKHKTNIKKATDKAAFAKRDCPSRCAGSAGRTRFTDHGCALAGYA